MPPREAVPAVRAGLSTGLLTVRPGVTRDGGRLSLSRTDVPTSGPSRGVFSGMDHAPTFARHFARLVWQLLSESDAYDLQLASLQLLGGASRAGAVTIGVTGQTLLVNGAPLGEGGPEAEDLVAQLIGHSIHHLAFDQPSSPADVLLVARILATAPIAGDGGRSVSHAWIHSKRVPCTSRWCRSRR